MKRALQPLKLRNITIKNRLFFSSMGIDMASDDGSFSDSMEVFYKRVIDSGCGAVILGNATVTPESKLKSNNFALFTKEHAKSIERITQYANDLGVVLGIQLQHYGHQGNPAYSIDGALLGASGITVPSTLKRFPDAKFKALATTDINEIIHRFASSALLAESSGVKFIQLQAGNGYLFSSLQSPLTNSREDKYGGNSINRNRLLLETVQAIRKKISDNTILGIRLGIDDLVTGGTVVNDLTGLTSTYQRSGVDIIEVTVTTAETFHYFISEPDRVSKLLREGARTLRAHSPIPIAMTGLVKSVHEAHDLIQNGFADAVGMVRALFADNDLIKKTVSGNDIGIDKCLWDGKCFMDKSNPNSDRVYCCINKNYLRPIQIYQKGN